MISVIVSGNRYKKWSSLSDEETYGINYEVNRVLLEKWLDKAQKFVDRQILTVSQGELHARWQ